MVVNDERWDPLQQREVGHGGLERIRRVGGIPARRTTDVGRHEELDAANGSEALAGKVASERNCQSRRHRPRTVAQGCPKARLIPPCKFPLPVFLSSFLFLALNRLIPSFYFIPWRIVR